MPLQNNERMMNYSGSSEGGKPLSFFHFSTALPMRQSLWRKYRYFLYELSSIAIAVEKAQKRSPF